MADRPRLAATTQTSRPASTPAAVETPPRRPPRSMLRTTTSVSGPGSMTMSAAAAAKPSRAVSTDARYRCAAAVAAGLRRHEPVPHPRLGQQVARAGHVRLELAPELGDVDTEVVGLGPVRRPPDVLQQLPLSD